MLLEHRLPKSSTSEPLPVQVAMRLLILTDVFGITPELVALAHRFVTSPVLLSPYREQHESFPNEQDAYQAFLHNGGLNSYLGRVKDLLQSVRVDACVGFSAGATTAWRATCGEISNFPPALLFYGSRIREYAGLQPHSPVELIFAEKEPSFDVAPLAACLSDAGHAVSVWLGTRHGFMNARSQGFDVQAMEAGVRAIALFLAKACPSSDICGDADWTEGLGPTSNCSLR